MCVTSKNIRKSSILCIHCILVKKKNEKCHRLLTAIYHTGPLPEKIGSEFLELICAWKNKKAEKHVFEVTQKLSTNVPILIRYQTYSPPSKNNQNTSEPSILTTPRSAIITFLLHL